jgi:hypothetical protein
MQRNKEPVAAGIDLDRSPPPQPRRVAFGPQQLAEPFQRHQQ